CSRTSGGRRRRCAASAAARMRPCGFRPSSRCRARRTDVLLAGALALRGRIASGWAEIDGARLVGIGHGRPPRLPSEVVDGVLAPALCDLQVNGAGGHEVTGGPGSLDAIDALQLAHGVTSYLPTLISPADETA